MLYLIAQENHLLLRKEKIAFFSEKDVINLGINLRRADQLNSCLVQLQLGFDGDELEPKVRETMKSAVSCIVQFLKQSFHKNEKKIEVPGLTKRRWFAYGGL